MLNTAYKKNPPKFAQNKLGEAKLQPIPRNPCLHKDLPKANEMPITETKRHIIPLQKPI
jgi:hypothetical protein